METGIHMLRDELFNLLLFGAGIGLSITPIPAG